MRLSTVALIFDVDGTLCDSFDLAFGATNSVLASRGLREVSEAEYLEGCRFTTSERFARHAGLMPGDPRFSDVGADLGAVFDATYIDLVSPRTAPLFDGMRGLVERAAEALSLGCLTNAAVAYAEAVLTAHDVRPLFGTVHGADSVPRPKPHADGLVACCADLGVCPEDAAYVGDSPSDGAAARAAGFGASLGVAWPGAANSREILVESGHFDTVVDTLPELEALLFGGGGGARADDAAAFKANLKTLITARRS